MQTTLSLTKASFLAAMVAGWEGLGWNSGSYFADETGRNSDYGGNYVLPFIYTDKAKTVCAWGAVAKFFNAANAQEMHQSDFGRAARNAGLDVQCIAGVSNDAGSKEKAIEAVTKYLDENWPDDVTVTFDYEKLREAA